MKKVIFFLILIFLSFFTEASIHNEEYEKHKNDTPLFKYDNSDKKTLKTISPVLNKKIFGYLPYWANGTDNLRYSLLTDMLYFSCGAAADGSLSCNGWPDSAPIAEAHSYGVKVHLVITAFSSAIVSALVNSSGSAQSLFFANAYNKVKNAGADGINIDFESFGDVDPDTLAQFFSDLSYYFKSRDINMKISIALPAVDWYGNWDLELLNDVDYFFIMLYDFHYSGSNPGPCAPLIADSPWNSSYHVTSSIQHYVDNIGSGYEYKIIAGYPYYGRKWKSVSLSVPGTQSENGTSVLYNTVLSDYSVYQDKWDNGSMTPYKIWSQGSDYWQLWYDSAESIALKFDLVNHYNLGGSGMWALNYDSGYEDLWKEIAKAFTSEGAGSRENPVSVLSFPFNYTSNTYYYRSDVSDFYTCANNTSSTSGIDESGPEIWFEFETECDGKLTATVTDGSGSGSREDIDIHLLDSSDESSCILRSDSKIALDIVAGKYYLSADSYVSGGVVKGGPFTLDINFVPEEINECDNNPCPEGHLCEDELCGYSCVSVNDDNNDADDFPDKDLMPEDEDSFQDNDFTEISNDKDSFPESENSDNTGDNDIYNEYDEDLTALFCDYYGEIYQENDKWRDNDGCNICICQYGEVKCTVNMCDKKSSSVGCSVVFLLF